MNPAEIKLLNELYSKADIKTMEQLVEQFKERNSGLVEKLNSGNVPEHLWGLDKDVAVIRITLPSDIEDVLSVGIYRAYETKDMSILNNALYTYNRLRYLRDTMVSGGYDHSGYFSNVMELFAGNDLVLVRKMFADEKGAASKGHKLFVTCTNLIMSLLWNNDTLKESSLKGATKFLTLKNGRFDELSVLYLVSLINQDISKASEYLAEAGKAYKKATWIHNFKNPLLKVFGVYLHGMYNLAFHFLPSDKFETLMQPESTLFWKEFAEYNKATMFVQGQPFIVFENELSGVNKVYE